MNTLEQKYLSSREVAEMVGKDHSDLLKDIRRYQEYLTEGNFPLSEYFKEDTYKDSTGRTLNCYLVSKKGCEFIAHKLTGQKGAIFTAKYIDRFHEMQDALSTKEMMKLPSYPDALRAWADALEENRLLEAENAVLKPKAEFFDAVTDSKDAIPMANVAKVLGFKGIGRNNLFKILREEKILQPNSIPYQEYIDRGYFRVVEQRYDKPYGEVGINIKTLVFQKGIDFIRKLLINKGYV